MKIGKYCISPSIFLILIDDLFDHYVVSCIAMIKPHCTEDEILEIIKSTGNYTPRVQYALTTASSIHKDQLRDDGSLYLEQHVFPICNAVINRCISDSNLEDIITVALLHDVLEEDLLFDTEKLKHEIGMTLYSHLKLLSKKKTFRENLSHEEKYERNRLMMIDLLKGPRYVRIIKLEDRLNNLMCTEIHKNVPKYLRHIKETLDFFMPLADSVGENYRNLLQCQCEKLLDSLNSEN